MVEGQRIGVFGGTFDPPHIGHLALAVEVAEALALDRMLLVVANVPWQKDGQRVVTDAALRLEMVRAAVDPYPVLEASALEVERGGASYTADTLRELAEADPGAELFVVVGADAAQGLPTWERLDEVLARGAVVVAARDGEVGEPPAGVSWQRISTTRLDVSSSALRARSGAGRTIDVLVPPGVASIVARADPYRADR